MSINNLSMFYQVQSSGVYTATSSSGQSFGTLLENGVTQAATAWSIQQLADKGFVGIKVPDLPSSTISGTLGLTLVWFDYFDPVSSSMTRANITITRRSEYEPMINARFPITGGGHWEAWWIRPGNSLPVPPGSFRDPRLTISTHLDYPSASYAPCWGCTIEYVGYTGFNWIGPIQRVMETSGSPGGPLSKGLASFGSCTGPGAYDIYATVVGEIVPTRPFTVSHCLHNDDTLTHTFTLSRTSSQGWTYDYWLQQTPGNPAVVPLTGNQVTVSGGKDIGILAVITPTIVFSDSLREMFTMTATSTLSPTQVWAVTYSALVSPGYSIVDDVGPPLSQPKIYMPVAMRQKDVE